LHLSVNGAVLAHEHFHSVFGRLVQAPLYEYGKSKNIDLFEDYTGHNTNLFKKEFQELFFAYSSNSLNSINLVSSESDSQVFRDKLLNDTGVFTRYHMNKIFLMALNEGLADVWAWLYSSQPCFISNSLDLDASGALPADIWGWLDNKYFPTSSSKSNSNSKEVKSDDHDNRCLNIKGTKLEKKTKLNLLNQETLNSFFGNMKADHSKELFTIEKKVVNIMGYRLGTNLARLFYRRMEERGELNNPDVQIQWARHITNSLPQLLPKLKDVYIDGLKIKTLFPWEEAVDLLIFGEFSLIIFTFL
jgi:hypothetical protein